MYLCILCLFKILFQQFSNCVKEWPACIRNCSYAIMTTFSDFSHYKTPFVKRDELAQISELYFEQTYYRRLQSTKLLRNFTLESLIKSKYSCAQRWWRDLHFISGALETNIKYVEKYWWICCETCFKFVSFKRPSNSVFFISPLQSAKTPAKTYFNSRKTKIFSKLLTGVLYLIRDTVAKFIPTSWRTAYLRNNFSFLLIPTDIFCTDNWSLTSVHNS